MTTNKMSLYGRILFWFRDVSWNIRKVIDGDRFERERAEWRCGLISLDMFRTMAEVDCNVRPSFDTLLGRLREYMSNRTCGGRCPEMDCAMQYEEDGQLFSAHWFLDNKYQLHIRVFDFRPTSDKARCFTEVEIRGHLELRPDYDPLAHLRGEGLSSGCDLLWSILGLRVAIPNP